MIVIFKSEQHTHTHTNTHTHTPENTTYTHTHIHTYTHTHTHILESRFSHENFCERKKREADKLLWTIY